MSKAILRQDFGWALKRLRQGLQVRRAAWGVKSDKLDYIYLKVFAGGTENEHISIMYVDIKGIEECWGNEAEDLIASDYYEHKFASRFVKKKKYRKRQV